MFVPFFLNYVFWTSRTEFLWRKENACICLALLIIPRHCGNRGGWYGPLTWGRDKMAAILQTFFNYFSWTKIVLSWNMIWYWYIFSSDKVWHRTSDKPLSELIEIVMERTVQGYLIKQEAQRERKPSPYLVWGQRNSLVFRKQSSKFLLLSISWKFHDFPSICYLRMLLTKQTTK